MIRKHVLPYVERQEIQSQTMHEFRDNIAKNLTTFKNNTVDTAEINQNLIDKNETCVNARLDHFNSLMTYLDADMALPLYIQESFGNALEFAFFINHFGINAPIFAQGDRGKASLS